MCDSTVLIRLTPNPIVVSCPVSQFQNPSIAQNHDKEKYKIYASSIILLHITLFPRSRHQRIFTMLMTKILRAGPRPLLRPRKCGREGRRSLGQSPVNTADGFPEAHGAEEGTKGRKVGRPCAETHLDHDPEGWVEDLKDERLFLVGRRGVAPAKPSHGVGNTEEDGSKHTSGGGAEVVLAWEHVLKVFQKYLHKTKQEDEASSPLLLRRHLQPPDVDEGQAQNHNVGQDTRYGKHKQQHALVGAVTSGIGLIQHEIVLQLVATDGQIRHHKGNDPTNDDPDEDRVDLVEA